MEQRSPEWYQERVGHVTASRFSDVLSKGKGNVPSKTRDKYLSQIVAEWLTNVPQEEFKGNAATDWGIEQEPFAFIALEEKFGAKVEPAPFVKHIDPEITLVGASPDGYIQIDGRTYGVEVKCPYVTTNHIATLRGGMPDDHVAQVQGGMWVTGLSGWIFASYDPRLVEHLRLHAQVVEKDPAFHATLATGVQAFLAEARAEFNKLMGA